MNQAGAKSGTIPPTTTSNGSGPSKKSRSKNSTTKTDQSTASTKFQGLNQDELKGVVIDHNIEHKKPASQQFDALWKAVTVAGGKMNPDLGPTLRLFKMKPESDYKVEMPDESDYTTVDENGNDVVDQFAKELVSKAWIEENKERRKEYRKYCTDLKKMFAIIYGQLSPGIVERLQAVPDWETIEWEYNTIKLLECLKEICYRDSESKVHRAVDSLSKLKKFVSTYQDNKDVVRFAEDVKMRHDVLKASGLEIRSKELITYVLERSFKTTSYDDYKKLNDKEKQPIHDAVDNLLIAVQIIEGSNRKLHRNVAGALRDSFTLGQDPYPMNPNSAIDILIRYTNTDPKKQQPSGTSSSSSKSKEKNRESDKKPEEKEANATAFVTDGAEQKATEVGIQEAKVLLTQGIANGERFDSFDELCFIHLSAPDTCTDNTCKTEFTFHGPEWDDVPDLIARTDPYPDSDSDDKSVDTIENFWTNGDIDEEDTQTNIQDHKDKECKAKECKAKECKAKECKAKECKATTYTEKGCNTPVMPDGGVAKCSPSVEYLFAQRNGRVDPYWLLLDSQATCNVVANKDILRNIRHHPDGKQVHIQCNAGRVTSTQIGDLPSFGPVWYLPTGIANILSLALVSDRYRVTLDTAITQAFFVHRSDGSTRRFDRMGCDLYASDLKETNGTVLAITTVQGKKEFFSERDIKNAQKARKIQESIGFPSTKDFLRILDKKLMLNCPITRQDALNAAEIFGVNTSIIKGKTVRRQPQHTITTLLPVPHAILSRYHNVTLGIDVYTVNGTKFLRSISRHLYFRTSRVLPDAKKTTLINCITAIQGVYKSRGFAIQQIHADNEFECLRDELKKLTEPIDLHCVARGCHEPFIERDNRTNKERCRCTFAAVPFQRMPHRMTIELVNGVNFWLNYWCSKGGVSKTISPREIMTGVPMDYNKHAKFQFGDYVLGHEEDGANTMKARAIDAIYLRPSGNVQGGMYLFDLKTGRRVHRLHATPAHMTDTIIRRVEEIAREQNAPIGINFGDSQGSTTILDIDERSVASDDDASDKSYNEDDDTLVDTALTGVTQTSEVSLQTDQVNQHNEHNNDNTNLNDNESEDVQNEQNGNNATHTGNQNQQILVETVNEDDDEDDEDNNSDDDDVGHNDVDAATANGTDDRDPVDDTPADDAASTVTGENATGRRPGLRPSVQRTHNKFGAEDGFESTTVHRSFFSAGYTKAIRQLEKEHEAIVLVSSAMEQYNNLDASLVTKQYGVKKGLELFGDAGVEAILKELKQLHDRNVVSPVHPKNMTHEQVRRALPYLMFLKRKRCGKIKGRGCADGRSQRDFISKEDASSPTVSLHALMLSCVIDAIEGRDVATADIPGAFLQTDMPEGEDVYIRLDGTMAELLAKLDPEKYGPCMVNSRGKKVIYAKANKAIYGTLRAALLFWEKLTGKLKEWGFEANPYDMCTMNKMVNNKQLTVVWHVDDLKISHKDSAVVTKFLEQLNTEFGRETPLTVTRGKIHEYVGMTIDYSEHGRVKFSMIDYVADVLSDLPDYLSEDRITTSPAGDHLFKVNKEAQKVNSETQEIFHTYVAKLLFVAKRARPDIQTAVAFLCTRVQAPDVDDIKKLKRVLSYLRTTIFLPLVLGWDGTGNTYWYVDASFAVHADMRSHTGAAMTMGQGAIISMSTKQKINTKSSTEAELVGADDALPFNMWCYYFLQWQGYHALGCNPFDGNSPPEPVLGEKNILYQDNTSAMKLEMNGKASSTKRTRHINIRFFMITDRVKSGEITVAYCPTEDMLADVFTKPLQGSLFRKFRNTILGISDADYMSYQISYEQAKKAKSK